MKNVIVLMILAMVLLSGCYKSGNVKRSYYDQDEYDECVRQSRNTGRGWEFLPFGYTIRYHQENESFDKCIEEQRRKKLETEEDKGK